MTFNDVAKSTMSRADGPCPDATGTIVETFLLEVRSARPKFSSSGWDFRFRVKGPPISWRSCLKDPRTPAVPPATREPDICKLGLSRALQPQILPEESVYTKNTCAKFPNADQLRASLQVSSFGIVKAGTAQLRVCHKRKCW